MKLPWNRFWRPGRAPIQWLFTPGADDEQIRWENFNSNDLEGWFQLQLGWRTWSWHRWRLLPFRSNRWILELSPERMRLEHSVLGRRTVVCAIGRSEAGELAIETVQYARVPCVSMVAGRSIDGTASFILPDQTVSTGGLLGLQRVALSRVLVSWWPLNARSRVGLLAFEHCFDGTYWNPSGLPTFPRVMDLDEYACVFPTGRCSH